MHRTPDNSFRSQLKSGFTLIEVMISLVIFAIIMAAIAMCVQAAFRSQRIIEQRQEENAVVRAVLGIMTRDLQSAIGVPTNPSALFQAGSNGTLIAFTTRTNGIIAPGLDPASQSQSGGGGLFGQNSGTNSAPSGGGTTAPQSDVSLVRYDYDPNSGQLIRTVSPVPNAQQFLGNTPSFSGSDPKATIGTSIVSITLRFWDASSGGWRNTWNFTGQAPPDPAQSGTETGTDPNSAASASSPTAQTSNGGDTALPTAVQIECVINAGDNRTATFTTSIPITASQPLSTIGQNTTTGASGTNGTATGTGGAGQ